MATAQIQMCLTSQGTLPRTVAFLDHKVIISVLIFPFLEFSHLIDSPRVHHLLMRKLHS